MEQESTIRRIRGLEIARGIFGLLALSVAVTQIGGLFWWEPTLRIWLSLACAVPLVAPILASILVVASRAELPPLISRSSVLWRWARGVGVAIAAAFAFALTSIVGGVLADLRTLPELASGAQILVAIATAWILLAWLWWSAMATIDLARLGLRGRIEAASLAVGARTARPRAWARAIAEFGDPWGAVICGGVGALSLTAVASSALTFLGAT